jgi:outer membrane protein assembly factor BamB
MRGVPGRQYLTSALLLALAACGPDDTGGVVPPPPTDPTTQWEATIGSNGLPVEALGRVAIPNRADFTLSGLDPATGREIWLRALPQGTFDISTIGDVIVATKQGATDSTSATYIDPNTGLNLWSLRASASQPVLLGRVGSILIASINDTLLVGLDRTSGNEAWRVALGPLTCVTGALCGRLRLLGVDRGDGIVLRQSSVEARLVTVRETGVTAQVVAQSAVLRRLAPGDQAAVIAGSGVVVATSGAEAVGVDATSGSERFRTTFTALIPAGFDATPIRARFTADGSLLVALFGDPTAAREVVLDMSTGQQTRSRAIPRAQLSAFHDRCGADGYAYLQENGFEFVSLRSGQVVTVNRPGIRAALTAAGLTNAFATGNGYVIFSLEFSRVGRHIGVRCAP